MPRSLDDMKRERDGQLAWGKSPYRQTAPFQKHSETSHDAAVEIEPELNDLQRRVLAYIVAQGALGATDEEAQRALGMNPSTQRPRRVELVNRHLIRDSGKMRKTISGRRAVVWVARSQRGAV